MKSLTLSIISILFVFLCHSQIDCHADHMHEKRMENSAHRATFAWMNEQILDKIIANRSGGGEDEILTIPTVVHVIHNGGDENLPLSTVQTSIDWLNLAYANEGEFSDPEGYSVPIQFCLAGKDPEGNFTEGVNYVQSELTDMLVPSQDETLKALSVWDTERYLNIWLVNSITREDNSPGVIGYSTFPDSHGTATDGIVVEAEFLGVTGYANSVLVHEVGHYLGLFHTFQNGCPNDDCLTSGDMVCDTPPDNNLNNFFCFDGTNSCLTDEDDESDNNPFRPIELGGLGDQFDMQSNYMDYSSLYCFKWITPGQSERIIATLTEIRSSLLEEDNCTPPCENEIAVSTSASTSLINVGEAVSFQDSSTGNTSTQWFVDSELQSSEQTFEFTPGVQGDYEVELILNNGDPGCEYSQIFPVTVNCPISILILPNSANVSLGGTVTFDTEITGATSYEWFVDNVSSGTDPTLEYTFSDLGISSVYLIASNGICEVQSQLWNISVGSCSSGREHSIWHWLNEDGAGFGMNFNESPMELLPSDPSIGNGHCKATICDDAGNLKFISVGNELFDRNYDLVTNGSELLGHPSSHFGTMFLKMPGNEGFYYLFTAGNQESNFSQGLRYSIIDGEANDGLGEVTDQKNILVEFIGTEHLNIIKHCNMVDKWLVFYDIPEAKFKSYLISESGISNTPVETDLGLSLTPNADAQPIKCTPQGNRLMYENYLLDFNQATGEVEVFLDMEFDLAIAYDFSPNGKVLYVYHGEINTEFSQYDLTLPAELIVDNAFNIPVSITDFGKDMQKGQDGILYFEQTITGGITTVSNPNLLGELMDYEDDAIPANTLINSFGNFYHAYIAGSDMLIDGDEIICAGTEHDFSVYESECIAEDIEWEFSGDGSFVENDDQSVTGTFPQVGEAMLIAKSFTDCGEITDTLHISIIQAPELYLGPDIGYCAGDGLVELEMSDEFEFYLWSTGNTTQSIEILNPETQTIEARGYYQGCFITDEINIIGELSPIDLGPDTDLCEGSALVLDAGAGYSDYVWQDGSTGQTYTAFLGGNYSVSVSEPCASFDEIFIDECGQNVGINEEDKIEFSVYPNPTSDELRITVNQLISESTSIRIIDATGKLVQLEEGVVLNNQEIKVSVENLAEGSYTISLNYEGGFYQENFVILRQ